MEINITNLKKLLIERFFGNKSLMAKILGLEVSHVNKVLKKDGKGAGAKFCGAIIRYCENNDLDYKEYVIFLDNNVNKITKTTN